MERLTHNKEHTLKKYLDMNKVDYEVVHYVHYKSKWYYWVDNFDQQKFVASNAGIARNSESVAIDNNIVYTEHECKEYLRGLFPNHKIMKALPIHIPPERGVGGSRPKKNKPDRKRQLQAKKYLQELSNN